MEKTIEPGTKSSLEMVPELSETETPKESRKRRRYKSKFEKGFACGWCKFRAQFSKTVVRHHYARHSHKELNMLKVEEVPMKKKKREKDATSSYKFNCNDCTYTSALRHEILVHSQTCHSETFDHGGITDYDSDSGNNPMYPQSFYNKGRNDSFYDHQKRFNLREMKIQCKDIFESGIEALEKTLSHYGVSKVCVDSLSESTFILLAVHYKSSVSYAGRGRDWKNAVKLSHYSDYEIRQLIKDDM